MSTRELARKAIKSQITSSAVKLLQSKGYAETTIEDIANDVGMSKRNFFRYFGSKDELLLAPVAEFCEVFLSSFKGHMANQDIWSSLYQALQEHATGCIQSTPTDHAPIESIIRSTPVLLARQLEVIERLIIDATDAYYALSKCTGASEWRAVNAVVRTAFACLQAIQCKPVEIDVKESFRILMEDMRPASLSKHS